MKAGQKRKLYRNMQYEQSARQIGVAALALFAPLAPVLMIAFAIMALVGVSSASHTVGVTLAAAAMPALGGRRDLLEVIKEGDDKGFAEVGGLSSRIANFQEKFVGLVKLITNESGLSMHKRTYLLKEAETTSDFPILFGYIIDRQLLAKYKAATPNWRNYVKVGTQIDFRPADAIGIYGLQGQLQQVAPRGEYKSDAALGDGKVSITLAKYGRVFPLAWEALINDDLGAFSDIADRLNTAAMRTEWYRATSLFATAAGPSTALFGAPIVHPIDGANVTNSYSGAASTFNIDNLGTACMNMRHQVDSDGEPVTIEGFVLVVPPALEYAMLQALDKSNVIMSGGDATAGVKSVIRTSANVTANLSITGYVNPYLPIIDVSGNANKTWYLFAQLSDGAAVKINFLKGHENPEVCMKNPNKLSLGGGSVSPLEGNFENDAVLWRIRHVLGGAAIDPRYAQANVGA